MQVVLNKQVLVLNRLWQAVHICSARRAFVLLYQGYAQVVSTDPEDIYATYDFASWQDVSERKPEAEMACTITRKLRIPRVIVLSHYDRLPKKEIRFTRHNIFERDKNTCQYCYIRFDRKDLNIDHVIPRDKGGKTTWENVVCSCIPCNSRKGNKLPREAGMQLLKTPEKPKWRPFIHFTFGVEADASWQHFLDVAYWNVELG